MKVLYIPAKVFLRISAEIIQNLIHILHGSPASIVPALLCGDVYHLLRVNILAGHAFIRHHLRINRAGAAFSLIVPALLVHSRCSHYLGHIGFRGIKLLISRVKASAFVYRDISAVRASGKHGPFLRVHDLCCFKNSIAVGVFAKKHTVRDSIPVCINIHKGGGIIGKPIAVCVLIHRDKIHNAVPICVYRRGNGIEHAVSVQVFV